MFPVVSLSGPPLHFLFSFFFAQINLFASECPGHHFLFFGCQGILFHFVAEIHQFESVPDEVLFDDEVDRHISSKRRSVVDLQNNRIDVCINYDIESQQLETHVVG